MSVRRVEIDRVVVDGITLDEGALDGFRGLLEREMTRQLAGEPGDENAAVAFVAKSVITAIGGGSDQDV